MADRKRLAGYHRVLRRVLILIVLLIVYGSLYPWHFALPHLKASPLWLLFHPAPEPFRYFVRDVIVNVALYIPLGFVGHLAFRGKRQPGIAIYGPVLLGLLVSVSIELTQLLVPVRVTSIYDVITNVTGSGCGVLTGLLFEALSLPRPRRRASTTVADRGALVLAFCWTAWLVFPLFPVLGLYELHRKFLFFAHAHWLDAVTIVSSGASWYAAGLLLTAAAGARLSRKWLPLMLLAIPAQFFIVDRQPVPDFLLGAIAGVALFLGYHRSNAPAKAEAWIFLAVILLRGLAPFHFSAGSRAFLWVPFVASLAGEWQAAASVLLEKIFLYGTAIWLLHEAGLKLARAIVVVAIVLAAIELAQIHLPNHTPEITDPILAVLMGFMLTMLSRRTRTVAPELTN